MTPCLSGDMLAEPGFDDGGVLATAAVDALHVPHHLGLLEDQRLRQNRVEMVTQNLLPNGHLDGEDDELWDVGVTYFQAPFSP